MPSDSDRAAGNMHKKFGEDRTCSSKDMIVDRQTHTQTDRHVHHNTPLPYQGRSNKCEIKSLLQEGEVYGNFS